MYDAKMEELARQIVQYSVGLQPGENLLIESWDGADDMTAVLIEAAYQAGGSFCLPGGCCRPTEAFAGGLGRKFPAPCGSGTGPDGKNGCLCDGS